MSAGTSDRTFFKEMTFSWSGQHLHTGNCSVQSTYAWWATHSKGSGFIKFTTLYFSLGHRAWGNAKLTLQCSTSPPPPPTTPHNGQTQTGASKLSCPLLPIMCKMSSPSLPVLSWQKAYHILLGMCGSSSTIEMNSNYMLRFSNIRFVHTRCMYTAIFRKKGKGACS